MLGAGFLIKLDAAGPRGKFLFCNEGVLAAFERVVGETENCQKSIPSSQVTLLLTCLAGVRGRRRR